MADIVHVTVRSALLPDIEFGYDPTVPAAPPEEGPGSWFMRWLRPSVTVRAPLLGDVTQAPWGDPGPSSWPLVLLVPLGLALALFVGWRLLRR